MSSGDEVVDELEFIHTKFLRNSPPIRGLPVWNVRRANYIVFDLASNADHADPRPVRRASLDTLKELSESLSKVLATLRRNLGERLDLGGGARAQIELAQGEAHVGATNVADHGHELVGVGRFCLGCLSRGGPAGRPTEDALVEGQGGETDRFAWARRVPQGPLQLMHAFECVEW
eukprot:CAMPEP_0185577026 /NCGR_PEP_ID=MMETSP0434-20130131/7827_1 /TAXON_ID=626734 ORGANISM="Favella taraikaensis, Strain Fe Narragansett Bay" /NCGR_SAMPLE_ID=MMETSP0434 /ASSEMBLY_ACC=CAM_ASM_000379 /LENGTH=174 /DNA_ID=CAMNT_0028194475 /DNA_START=938 /DNA_END=1459 /DNA_ORIENTATION=-